MAKAALGKGLGALISSPTAVTGVSRPPALAQPAPGDVVQRVSPEQIIPSPLQPRKEFQADQLAELMESIREHGIIQPLIVRRVNGKLELIAGERRFRASSQLGLKELPVIVREASDKDVLEMALIENLQREGLNPIEEAQAYSRLAKDFNMRQEDIAQRVGKNRATVANTMRLLDLPQNVRDMLATSKLSTGHAKVLLMLKNGSEQERVALQILTKGLTVRATEKVIDAILHPPPPPKPKPAEHEFSRAIEAVEQKLIQHLTTNVSIQHAEKKGRIEIDYYGVDDLNRILAVLGLEEESFAGN
ncbi:MAG: ParB/RepB/Spo0J family partition protein [Prosthecobacter sp.]|jgi:ParB family chromosome partitioning protein|uniref:ParB/RepB/Spo0J family partition protein n=1 Tax=Prosthecobacter sp. TaxID=1965333 RepID=UPI0019E00E3E|nr:ParB/RepB/Spo0J family partition protein [Prosthecobacter sp.]MBE2282933.1 ParB/RepB/Spo0J family partition protein [Prosthecobacter sp.]